jgi:hypothetical protein
MTHVISEEEKKKKYDLTITEWTVRFHAEVVPEEFFSKEKDHSAFDKPVKLH